MMTLKEKCLLITLSLATLLMGGSSYAAAIYSAGATNANGNGANNSNSPVTYYNKFQFAYGNNTVDARAEHGSLWGRSKIGIDTGTIFSINEGGSATANLTYNDLIFIDTNNPTSTARVDVSVNFFTSSYSELSSRDAGHSPSVFGEVRIAQSRADISVSLFDQNTTIQDADFSGLYTTPTASVPLNTFVSLNMSLVSYAQLYVGPDTNASFFTDSMVQLAGLSAIGGTSFNLPDGISVFSAQGGFSEVGAVSAVPIPATIWLFGSALIGLARITSRKKT